LKIGDHGVFRIGQRIGRVVEVIAVADQNTFRLVDWDSGTSGLVGGEVAFPGVIGEDGACDARRIMVYPEPPSIRRCLGLGLGLGLDRIEP
jgi:hypothetical protein